MCDPLAGKIALKHGQISLTDASLVCQSVLRQPAICKPHLDLAADQRCIDLKAAERDELVKRNG
jgi:hypothetical protein